MAINFPSTAGQPIDGTFTYTTAGITYSWNGESWTAAGAGATATDLTIFSVSNATPSGGGSLSYNTNSGEFTFTPPNLSSYLTSTGSINTHTDVTISNPSDKQLIVYNGANIRWENLSPGSGSGLDADLLDGQHGSYYRNAGNLNAGTISSDRLSGTYSIDISGSANSISNLSNVGDVTITSPSSGQTLRYNGSGWVNSDASGIRDTATYTATSLGNNAATNFSFTTPNTYALLKVQTSHAAWLTLYTDTGSRTSDSTRSEDTDPLPGSGVIAEVITTGAITQLITPSVIGFSSTQNNVTYAKLVNKSGSTASVQVTLTFVPLEV